MIFYDFSFNLNYLYKRRELTTVGVCLLRMKLYVNAILKCTHTYNNICSSSLVFLKWYKSCVDQVLRIITGLFEPGVKNRRIDERKCKFYRLPLGLEC